MINDVKTKKVRIYNFINKSADRFVPPLVFADCGPMQDGSLQARFNILALFAFFLCDLTWPAHSCRLLQFVFLLDEIGYLNHAICFLLDEIGCLNQIKSL